MPWTDYTSTREAAETWGYTMQAVGLCVPLVSLKVQRKWGMDGLSRKIRRIPMMRELPQADGLDINQNTVEEVAADNTLPSLRNTEIPKRNKEPLQIGATVLFCRMVVSSIYGLRRIF